MGRHAVKGRARRLAVALAVAPWAAGAMAAPATPDAAEKAVADDIRPIYARLLAKAGSTLKPGTPAFEAALTRSASAFLAARPDDCGLDDWMAGACRARSFVDPSSSMEPSIHEGDMVLAVPVDGQRPIQRGDVLAFHSPKAADRDTIYVSRVVGLPGDRVSFVRGILAIDGTRVGRVRAGRAMTDRGPAPRSTETLPGGWSHAVLGADDGPVGHTMDELTVPSGHYFMMGDNRPVALDSRYAAAGDGPGLPASSDIVARASLIYVSKDVAQIGRSP